MNVKVMIVEDEAILRQGIVSLIDWKSLNCTVVAACENPLKAIEYMQEHSVDLIISDIRMPQMDGITFAEHLSQTHPEVAVIILSAYSDFSYVQKAVALKNVVNYTLKSNFVKELPVVLESTLVRLQMQRIRPSITTQQKRLFFKDILEGRHYDETFTYDFLRSLQIEPKHYYIVLLEVVIEDLVFNYGPDYSESISSIQNFINMSFQDLSHVTVPLSDSLIVSFISFDELNTAKNSGTLYLICNDLLSTVRKYMSFGLNLSISTQHDSLKEISQAYKEAKSALSCSYSNECIALSDSTDNEEDSSVFNALEEARCVSKLISRRNLQEIDSYCEDLFRKFEANGIRSDRISFKLNLLLSSSLMILTNGGIKIDHVCDVQQDFLKEAMEPHSNYYLRKLFANTIRILAENRLEDQSGYSKLITATNAYIKITIRRTFV